MLKQKKNIWHFPTSNICLKFVFLFGKDTLNKEACKRVTIIPWLQEQYHSWIIIKLIILICVSIIQLSKKNSKLECYANSSCHVVKMVNTEMYLPI